MLRKMYLVPADHYRRGRSSPKKRSSRRKKQHAYEELVKMRHKIREADIRRKTRTKAISDFLSRVMPDRTLPYPEPELSEKQLKVEAKTPPPLPFLRQRPLNKDILTRWMKKKQ